MQRAVGVSVIATLQFGTHTPTVKRIPVNVQMNLPAAVKRDGRYFVSWCPVLDVFSQGATEAEALENLVEALRLFLESCIVRGTITQVLKDCGFTVVSDPATRRKIREHGFPEKYEAVRVPIELLADDRNREPCPA